LLYYAIFISDYACNPKASHYLAMYKRMY